MLRACSLLVCFLCLLPDRIFLRAHNVGRHAQHHQARRLAEFMRVSRVADLFNRLAQRDALISKENFLSGFAVRKDAEELWDRMHDELGLNKTKPLDRKSFVKETKLLFEYLSDDETTITQDNWMKLTKMPELYNDIDVDGSHSISISMLEAAAKGTARLEGGASQLQPRVVVALVCVMCWLSNVCG
eukprot:TRINITY_DN21383_c0_g1_i2.p1 TRINITY_DN21383_c0_g1~~TRINITY_DN21383_c0_g1_i2.p1  ORF type:complete len:187 (+),score=19.52 TRINITY_DN21383_c0_g1_i2:43-603(+)